MKIFFCALLLAALAAVAAETHAIWPHAKNQLEMNEAAAGEHSEADAELNRIYREILARNRDDGVLVQKLRDAQRAWLNYRDAHLESCWPDGAHRSYGSVHPMCRSLGMTRMTLARIEELKEFLAPESGDVCGCAVSPSGRNEIGVKEK